MSLLSSFLAVLNWLSNFLIIQVSLSHFLKSIHSETLKMLKSYLKKNLFFLSVCGYGSDGFCGGCGCGDRFVGEVAMGFVVVVSVVMGFVAITWVLL